MDLKLLLSFQVTTLPSSSSLFNPNSISTRRNLSTTARIYPSSALVSSKNATFFGQSLNLGANLFLSGGRRHVRPIEAAVKWRKEFPFDGLIERDKKLKLVLKIRNILVNQPNRIMSLKHLGRFRRDLGLTKKRKFIALLKKFPAVFEIVEEGAYSLKFQMTPEAERFYLEELKLKNEMEDHGVLKLRKLLMMSSKRIIDLKKIAHLKNDLGLPSEFMNTICRRYPQYFKTVSTERGPALELTHWDPSLAVSAAELSEDEKRAREMKERNLIIERIPKFNMLKLPKGLTLSKKETERVTRFNRMPYISPYSDFSKWRFGSPEKEKHACGVVHEILSMTLEKRTLVDHLTHFRDEFKFSQQVRGMLIRHPEIFYVSLKGSRDSVFLREAYCGNKLVEKHRLLLLKEKMRALVTNTRFSKAPERIVSGEKEVEERIGEEEDVKGWSDVDEILAEADGEEDEDDDYNSGSGNEVLFSPDFHDLDDVLSFEEEGMRGASVPRFFDRFVTSPANQAAQPRERW